MPQTDAHDHDRDERIGAHHRDERIGTHHRDEGIGAHHLDDGFDDYPRADDDGGVTFDDYRRG